MNIVNLQLYKLQKGLENNSFIINEKKIANQILNALGYNQLQRPTPIIKIAKSFGIRSFTEQPDCENIVGKLYVNGKTQSIYNCDRAILVNPNHHRYYNRVIIANLLGYYLMNVIRNENYKKKEIFLYNDISADDVYTIHQQFILNIMMPTKVFLEQLKIAKEELPIFYRDIYLCKYFEVPLEGIKRKIYSLD